MEERFWPKVNKEGGPIHPILGQCWEWIGARNDAGYGQIWDGDKVIYAHRVSYEFANGPIPGGLVIDHLCRTPACVNPAHLEPVTNAENVRRGMEVSELIHRRKAHCPLGHAYDGIYNGQQICRTCINAQKRARRARAKAEGRKAS